MAKKRATLWPKKGPHCGKKEGHTELHPDRVFSFARPGSTHFRKHERFVVQKILSIKIIADRCEYDL